MVAKKEDDDEIAMPGKTEDNSGFVFVQIQNDVLPVVQCSCTCFEGLHIPVLLLQISLLIFFWTSTRSWYCGSSSDITCKKNTLGCMFFLTESCYFHSLHFALSLSVVYHPPWTLLFVFFFGPGKDQLNDFFPSVHEYNFIYTFLCIF